MGNAVMNGREQEQERQCGTLLGSQAITPPLLPEIPDITGI